MSEFPDWVEDRIGLGDVSHEEAKELHRALKWIYRLIPDIEEKLRTRPDPAWPFWKRYLWYANQR